MTIRKVFLILISCLLITLLMLGCGSAPQELKKPEIQFTIQKKDVPKADPSAWAAGSKRQVSYWVQVPKGTTQDQVKQVAEYITESDAKPLKNWNVAWFVFITPDNQESGFATGLYTKNAKIPDGNQVKPGQYESFSWGWTFHRQP
jgi:hypothetical protein